MPFRARPGACPGIRPVATACTSAVVLLIAFAASAAAQETRAEEIAARQREKAKNLEPYKPSRAEAILISIEENFASPPNGFYPELGKIYQGGGFSFGVGYRHFYAREAVWNVRALYSLKNYKQVEVGTRTPWHTNGKWTLDLRAGWLDAPQVAYYGVGMAPDAVHTTFHATLGYGHATAEVRPTGWTRLLGEVGYEDYDTKGGSGNEPSIEQIYNPDNTPGLFSNPAFVRSGATAAIDWRPSPGYARTGGYYGVTLANYDDLDDVYSFSRLDAELIQHLPILRETWVVSLHGRVQSIVDDDDIVPYFMLPQLGSGRTLRGYETGRFRDRHSILTTAELRWVPNRTGLDLALFYDAGKVTSRREDLDLDGLESNWGIGARFHGKTATVLRIEAARGSNGWRLVVGTSAAF